MSDAAAAPAPLVEFTLIPKGTLITPETALSIEQAFAPYVEQFKELSAHVATITDPREAKVTRLKLRKVRTDTDKKHQELKAESLAYGRTLDHCKNLINGQIEPIEEKLEAIEKAEERRIAALIAERRQQHLAALAPYLDPTLPAPFVDGITDSQFSTMLENAKTLHEARLERERKEQEEKTRRELEAAQERERLRVENERLQREAREREEKTRLERAEMDRRHAEEQEKLRKQRESDAAAARKRMDEIQAKAKKDHDKHEAKLAEERRRREEAEAKERQAKIAEQTRLREAAEAEERRKREAEEAEERAAAAPDREKIIAFCRAILATPLPAVKGAKAKRMVKDTAGEVQAQINMLETLAKKL